MKRSIVFIAFLLAVALPSLSQSHLADSLLALLKQHPQQNTSRVNWLNELGEQSELMPEQSDSLSLQALSLARKLGYVAGEVTAMGLHSAAQARVGNKEQALMVAGQALELASKSGTPHLIAQALRRQALVYRYQGEYDKALENNLKALRLAKQADDSGLVSKVLIELGLLKKLQGNLKKAMAYLQQSLQASEPNTSLQADVLRTIADMYRSEGDLVPAAENALEALEVARQANDAYRTTLSSIQLSYIYNSLEEPSQALFYGLPALEEAERFKDLATVASVLNSIGTAYALMKQYPNAINYYRRSLNLLQQLKNKISITNRQANLADVYELQGDYDKALQYAYKSLAGSTATGEKVGLARVMNVLSRVHLHTGRLDSSLWYGERSLKLAQEIGNKSFIQEAYQVLSQGYAQQKDTARAYQYQLLYAAYNDSITNLQAGRRIELMQHQADIERKQSEIDLLSKSNQLQHEAAQRQRQLLISLFAGLALTLLLVSVMWQTNRQKQKSNAELLKLNKKIEKQRDSLETAITKLKATQEQLVQKEKMASLGELTAGIAHEIQNPLNFVNNFSEVSTEMMQELEQVLLQRLEREGNGDAVMLIKELTQNLARIHQHGKRADAIVRGMLQHSLTSKGVKESIDINALADEYLRLSYHGMRSKDKEFSVRVETDFDESLKEVEVVPQEVARVLLNVFNNAFYAVQQKKREEGAHYEPEVKVSTRLVHEEVEIRVRDNGVGMPEDVEKKIFQPFFTTKPSGEGTGLGLSLSYDIITKGHKGEIQVNTKKGAYTEFIIKLPLSHIAEQMAIDESVIG